MTQRFADVGNRRCIIVVPEHQSVTADRIESYASSEAMEVIETIMGAKTLERLLYYIEKDAVQTVLVRQVTDITVDEAELHRIMEIAAEHGVSINAEERNYYPITIGCWDGGSGC